MSFLKSVLLITLLFSFVSIIFGDIKSSHHNFSGSSWSNGEICIVCHTPHNANVEVQDSPLWNHQLTTSVFEVYSSQTLDAFPGQPNGKSKLCLSCHDGTIAIENFGGTTTGSRFVSPGFGLIGTKLSSSHPISFIYNSALAATDGNLHDPEVTLSGLGGTIAFDMLENGSLECTSCHDVHVSRNTQGCVGCHNLRHQGGILTKTLSLIKSNDDSALCLTCHKK